MATVTDFLTLEQFHKRYDGEPGYEYWFGKAVKKPLPDWMHGALQLLLGDLLFRVGYFAASEASLRIDPQWEPRPDVSGLHA
jgi:Uma2 family endonuclease